MAVDTETKRVSALMTSAHHPGKWFGPSEPDAGDLDSNSQRGFQMWHYAGIDADAPAAAVGFSQVIFIS